MNSLLKVDELILEIEKSILSLNILEPGQIRAKKGRLVEYLAENLVKIAWLQIKGQSKRLTISKKRLKIPMQQQYIKSIKDESIRQYIDSNIDKYIYYAKVDRHICIDDKLVILIECKSYTENAMLKRILVDFSLIQTVYNKATFYLFQLESQLGGDHGSLKTVKYGSFSSHTLMSYFSNIDLNICTFIKGERNIHQPIHKPEFFKHIVRENVIKTINLLSEDLKQYL